MVHVIKDISYQNTRRRSQNTLKPISMRIAPCEMLDLYLGIERNLFLSSGQSPPADMRNSAVCS